MNKEGVTYFSLKTSAPEYFTLVHLHAYLKRIFQNTSSITVDEVRKRCVIKTSYTFKAETVQTKLNIVPQVGQHIRWTSNGSLNAEEEGHLDDLLSLLGADEPQSWSTKSDQPPKKQSRKRRHDTDDEAGPS